MTPPRNVARLARVFFRPALALCLAPILAHLPELLGWVDTYPLLYASSLALHPHSGILPGQPFIDGNASSTMLCIDHLAAEDWLHGALPWWNPYTGAGLPLATKPGVFFLPFVLLLHFHSGVLLIKLAMQILAGLFCFAFLRQLGLAKAAALLASILFQCNGTFAWYADAPILPIAFMPLLLLGIERARTQAGAGRRGGQAIIALAIAFSVLAGFPEVTLLDGLLCLAFAAIRIRGLSGKEAASYFRKILAGGLTGLALAAPMLIPFLQNLPISSLGVRQVPALQARHFVSLLFPNIFGPPWADLDWDFWANVGGYFSAATLFLAVLSLFQRSPSPQPLRAVRWMLALWVCLWLAASFHAPVITTALHLIPGLSEVFIARYSMPSVEFALCVMAAFALDADARSHGRLSMWGALAVVGAVIGLALMLDYHQILASRQVTWAVWIAAISLVWGIGTVAGLFLLFRLPDFPLRRYLIAGIVCADAIGLFVPTTLSGATKPDMFDAPIDYLQANLHLQRAVSVDNSLPPNVGALLGLGSIRYQYAPVPTNWANFVQQLDPSASITSYPGTLETPESVAMAIAMHCATLKALAVRYVVSPDSIRTFCAPPDNRHFYPPPKRVFDQGGIGIFELPDPSPYAETSGAQCKLDVIDREHMHATCDAPARLIRRELMFPGWTARVNGHLTAIDTEGEIFQAVALPAGASDIIWRYAPLHAGAILAIFIAGTLALAALIVLGAARRNSLSN